MTDQTCEKCYWSVRDDLNDLLCGNSDSGHCADWVKADGHCENWEADHE